LNLKAIATFDNSGFEKAVERQKARYDESDMILRLFNSGLISKDEARAQISAVANTQQSR